jgi:hypothetical protein
MRLCLAVSAVQKKNVGEVTNIPGKYRELAEHKSDEQSFVGL